MCPPSEGSELHRRVDRDRWCVTRDDLVDFRRRLRHAVQRGEVMPTERDSFDPQDGRTGPTIYTVSEQFIKPITREAGMMSWALMLHPEGLKCDLFVTHAWQEGVFEFTDKVLHSWPYGTRHAYCCMLANPQNLDISTLIASPSDSPFAQALHSARHVLVVPNQRVSVYTRLWCAYEAYLAYENDKVINVARAGSTTPSVLWATARPAASAVCGLLLGWARHFVNHEQLTMAESFSGWVAMPALFLCSVVSHHSTVRRASNIMGAAVWGYYAVVVYLHDPYAREDKPARSFESLGFLCGVVYFIIAEADLVRELCACLESEQLCKGYTGSIRDASCTVQRDADFILAEINSKVAEVDDAIQILIKAGAWNKRMRSASDSGVDIKEVVLVEYAVPSASSLVHLLIITSLMSEADWFCRLFGAMFFVLQLCWLVRVVVLPDDRQAFGVKASAKIGTLWFGLIILIHFVCIYALGIPLEGDVYRHTQSVALLFIYVLDLVCLAAGVDGVADWPICGRGLAQCLLGRGLRDCAQCGRGTRRTMSSLGQEAPQSDIEESTESDSGSELSFASDTGSPS